LGAGFPDASQGVLSIDFYEAVTGFNVNDEANASVTLVGHSLGGGLAGFVGMLSGNAAANDNAPLQREQAA